MFLAATKQTLLAPWCPPSHPLFPALKSEKAALSGSSYFVVNYTSNISYTQCLQFSFILSHSCPVPVLGKTHFLIFLFCHSSKTFRYVFEHLSCARYCSNPLNTSVEKISKMKISACKEL